MLLIIIKPELDIAEVLSSYKAMPMNIFKQKFYSFLFLLRKGWSRYLFSPLTSPPNLNKHNSYRIINQLHFIHIQSGIEKTQIGSSSLLYLRKGEIFLSCLYPELCLIQVNVATELHVKVFTFLLSPVGCNTESWCNLF